LAGDEVTCTSNIQQVADYICTWSTGNAVIVFGDTNSRYTRTADNIRVLSTQSLLSDAWVVFEHSGTPPATESICDNPSLNSNCETVDKVFYRGNAIVSLTATYFNYESTKFLQPNGSILYDHNPITATFSCSLSPKFQQSKLLGRAPTEPGSTTSHSSPPSPPPQ
jgi:endonuclease/exonuclease/phosphatase (EEP) superfamily protein YafD